MKGFHKPTVITVVVIVVVTLFAYHLYNMTAKRKAGSS